MPVRNGYTRGVEIETEPLAREFLRALRGGRSQVAWSRRLGYRSNVASPWETGRRWPMASEVFRAIERAGGSIDSGLQRFHGTRPAWLDDLSPISPEAVAAHLRDLRGDTTVSDLARRSGQGRTAVSRWLTGRTQPRLPAFFAVIHASSVRLPDWIASFVPPMSLPTLAPIWRMLEARRNVGLVHPWTQAVLMALELDDYHRHPDPGADWLAARLGLDVDEVERCLQWLEDAGQITWKGRHASVLPLAVDTRQHPAARAHLKAHWTEVARERIRREASGQFSYNVFAVSRADLERIRELHLAYFTALRAIVSSSTPCERVAVANVQLFALDEQ